MNNRFWTALSLSIDLSGSENSRHNQHYEVWTVPYGSSSNFIQRSIFWHYFGGKTIGQTF